MTTSRSEEGDDLARAIEAEERAQAAARRVAWTLAEAEEMQEETAGSVAEIEALRRRHEKAEVAAERARQRRREVEAGLDPIEVVSAHARACGVPDRRRG